jgi:hypothetical protein
VTDIEDIAFNHCTNLTSVTIPDGVTNIGARAFQSCTSLTNVTIGNGVTSIQEKTFDACQSLASVAIGHGVTNIGDNAFSGTALMNVTIPNGVTSIGDLAFYGCTSLTNAPIPNRVTSIGGLAFAGSGLINVTIPSNVTAIGSGAFAGCNSLIAITVDPLNHAFSSLDGALFSNGQRYIVQWPGGAPGSYTIPDGVTDIAAGAFYQCTNLTSVTIPKSVMRIGSEAFQDCFGLMAGYFAGSAPYIVPSAFDGDRLTLYYLPGNAGWGAMSGGMPTAAWVLACPTILDNGFSVASGGFGFRVSWATNAVVVAEESASLAASSWTPITTNVVRFLFGGTNTDNGTALFLDPQWTNYPSRFYRVRSQ